MGEECTQKACLLEVYENSQPILLADINNTIRYMFFSGVVARHPDFTDYLRQALTPEAVEEYLAHLFEDRTGPLESRIKRYNANTLENTWHYITKVVLILFC